MLGRILVTTCLFAGTATMSHADAVDDLNAFVQALAIPVYAYHCEIMMDQDVMEKVNLDVVYKMELAGIPEEKGVEIQTQMVEEFAANADCSEGSSDWKNFEAALQAYMPN